MPPRERVEVSTAHQLDYATLDTIARECGGWMRSSGAGGESAEAWHDDKAYVFSGDGLIDFLYAVKHTANENAYAAIDLCDYIEKSATTPPSVFVRDAIVQKAAELRRKIKGEA